MKKFLALLLGCIVSLLPLTYAGANEEPAEKPDIKFVINSRPVKLGDVPLILGGQTLLPLRAVLTALGVPNDEDHIKWDGSDSSVTVVNGDSAIFLKVGSRTAVVGGKPVELGIAPIIYSKNQSVYIPVRFISNAVGKEVAWEDATRTVFIRDRNGYQEMKSVLERVRKAMEGIEKVRLSSKMKLDITRQDTKVLLDVSMNEKLDKKAGRMYSVTATALFGSDITFETFFSDNAEYNRGLGGSWEKETMDEKTFREKLAGDVSLEALNSADVITAALEKQEGRADGEYILRGALYPKNMASVICRSAGIGSLVPETSFFEAVLDAGTDQVKTLHAEFGGTGLLGGSSSEISASVDVDYTDYGGAFEIKTPEGL